MPPSSSNDRSNVLVHCVWALVAALAFGVGYVISTPPVTELVAGRKPASAAIEKGDLRQSPAPVEQSSGLPPAKNVEQSGGVNLARPIAPRNLDLPQNQTAEPKVTPDLGAAIAPNLNLSPAQSYPAHGSPLSREDAHKLLAGTVIFNPGSIPSSNVPVEPNTFLQVGQDIQIKYGSTWWAGTVLGMEQDGRVKVRYFGWASSYDESKTREELQLDRDARVRALDNTYVRQGW